MERFQSTKETRNVFSLKQYTLNFLIGHLKRARYDILCENLINLRGFEPRSPVYKTDLISTVMCCPLTLQYSGHSVDPK